MRYDSNQITRDEMWTIAKSFDGYAAFGSEQLGRIANEAAATYRNTKTLPQNINVLRGCLFFEFRRAAHIGSPTTEGEDQQYLHALVTEILLQMPQLTPPPSWLARMMQKAR